MGADKEEEEEEEKKQDLQGIRKGGRVFWGSWLRRPYGSEFP